jgi:hypothetical protein
MIDEKLAQQLASILAPALPHLIAGANKKAIEGASKMAGEEAWLKAEQIWSKIKPDIEKNPEINLSIHDAIERKGNFTTEPMLSRELEKLKLSQETLDDIRRIISEAKLEKIPDQRGALKTEVSTSTPVIFAGNEFSIYVVIRNPFPVPITICGTETHIPVELSDEIWRKVENLKLKKEQDIKLSNSKSYFKALLQIKYYLSNIYKRFSTDKGPRVAIAVGPENQEFQRPSIRSVTIGQNAQSCHISAGDTWNIDFANLPADEVHRILWDINEYIQGREPIVLYPGDSIVKHFILKSTHWLLFAPIAHTFQIQVRYEVDGFAHVDTVPFSLSIRSPMASSLVGAIIGSILGSLVNKQNTFNVVDMILLSRIFLTSFIFAIIVVVAFARKSNVQQIVSVEDFWGGLFIGFLVGYSGENFISSVIGKY